MASGEVGITLSGGGVRALLYGLGALRAVIAGLAPDRRLKVIVGVSGGAIGAAYAAGRLNLGKATVDDYDQTVLRPAFEAVTRRSLVFATWHLWGVVAGFGLALAVAAGAGAGGIDVPWWVWVLLIVLAAAAACFKLGWRIGGAVAVFLAIALAVGAGMATLGVGFWPRAVITAAALALSVVVVGWRGAAIERSMQSVLFAGNPMLPAADGDALLVLAATDLGSGENTYLTSRGVESYRWGTAPADTIPLARAARASATFPAAFPALHLKLDFSGGTERTPKRIALVDGGVYDNMGSEWLLNPRRTDERTCIVVVNASRNLGLQRRGYGTFGIGEVRVLVREQAIQYDASTAPRRRLLKALFENRVRRGAIVRIDKDLREWVEAFTAGTDDRAARAQAVLRRMGDVARPTIWQEWTERNGDVPTTLDAVPASAARDLLRAGYLATAVQLHILENWPAPPEIDPDNLFPWTNQP